MFGLCVFFLGCVSYLDKFPYSQVIRKTLKWSASLVIWQGKASPCAGRWRITLTVVAVIKSPAETSTDSDVRKSETLPTAGRNIKCAALGKTNHLSVPQMIKQGLPFDWQVHSWVYTQENLKIETCTPVFMATLFIIAKKQKWHNCSSADEDVAYPYNWYYSAIKMSDVCCALQHG